MTGKFPVPQTFGFKELEHEGKRQRRTVGYASMYTTQVTEVPHITDEQTRTRRSG